MARKTSGVLSPLEITAALCADLEPLRFGPPVTHVYNPLIYAAEPYRAYIERYGMGPREVILLGMNPGPWGMAQTGVPFGEVALVRDWLGIEGRVLQPPSVHPKRPVQGFACTRSEVSGARLWGWAKRRFGEPEHFFARFLILNYCPLTFMEESGRNRTPDKLPLAERTALLAACDTALRRSIAYHRPAWLIGIGAFAESAARRAVGEGGEVRVGCISHPSPASPKANAGWEPLIEGELNALGIL